MQIDTILLLFNRPAHSERVLASLKDNNVKKIHAYLDYSEDMQVKKNQARIKNSVCAIQDESFSVELKERFFSYGLAANIRAAINERFHEGADAVVVIEDDCVVRPGGFQFFFEGLNQLKNTKRVRSLCGYTPRYCHFITEPDADVVLLQRFLTWGWATWKDRWVQYEPNLRLLVESAKSLGIEIEDFSEDLGRYCDSDLFLDGQVDIWSINWILIHYLTSTFPVYPVESVIENIGLDGTGSNCDATTAFASRSNNEVLRTYKWTDLKYYPENEDIICDFMAKNSHHIYPDADS